MKWIIISRMTSFNRSDFVISAFLLSTCAWMHVSGHGRLWEPPGRSTMWRRGFPTPINTNDNELNCGGFTNQWFKYSGRCGTCGDPYQEVPHQNEEGGKYATGIIGRTYLRGQIITVTVDLTANHLGFFEFKLCPLSGKIKHVTNDCLNRHRLMIEVAQMPVHRYYVNKHDNGHLNITLRLPKNTMCQQCVLQWKYKTGNRWNCDENDCNHGVGPQEEFYSCADIAILVDKSSHVTNGHVTSHSATVPYLGVQHLTSQQNIFSSKIRTQNIQVQKISGYFPYKYLQGPELNYISLASSFQKSALDAVPRKLDEQGESYEMKWRNCMTVWKEEHQAIDTWCKRNCPKGYCPSHLCSCDERIIPVIMKGANAARVTLYSRALRPATWSRHFAYVTSFPYMTSKFPNANAIIRKVSKTNTQRGKKNEEITGTSFDSSITRPEKQTTSIYLSRNINASENERVKLIKPSEIVCKATKVFSSQPKFDKWCEENCSSGFCPSSTCVCTNF